MSSHELEARIKKLEDIEEIRTLVWDYTYFLDYGDLDSTLDCFVVDAEMEVGMRGGTAESRAALEGTYKGREAIGNLYRLVLPQKDRFSVAHMILNPVVTVEGEKAKGTFYLLETAAGERAMWGQGRYDVAFAKVGGKWKISRFKFLWNFMTPYDEGWVKTPMVGL